MERDAGEDRESNRQPGLQLQDTRNEEIEADTANRRMRVLGEKYDVFSCHSS